MDECIDSVGDAKIFTKLGENSRYGKKEIRNQDKDKKDFCSHHGLYKFIRMQFGLKNAPGTLQREIDLILSQEK